MILKEGAGWEALKSRVLSKSFQFKAQMNSQEYILSTILITLQAPFHGQSADKKPNVRADGKLQ